VWRHHVVRAALLDLQRLLPPRVRFPAILDLGCGSGRAVRLLDIVFRPDVIVGVDVDRAQLALAVPDARRTRCRVALRAGSAVRLPVPDASIDMVFCHQTFHHLWWSRPDMGLVEWLGRPARAPREPTLLNLVATPLATR